MADASASYANARVGIDRNTGKIIKGWAHCQQSIYVILTTRFNLRVMLLDFGADVLDLIDKPGNAATIAAVYVAIYSALTKWEPGFKLSKMQLLSASNSGGYTFALSGIFYPLGHLGDYSVAENASFSVTLK